MNKKVFISMLVLTVSFLVSLYVLKIFYPQDFVMSVSNEKLVMVGNFIDSHRVLSFVIGILMGCIFDYLYFGAVCRKIKLDFKLITIIVVYNIVYNSLYTFLPTEILIEHSSLFIVASTCYMIMTPMFFTKELLPLSITYCINYISQTLSLYIRDLALLLTSTNFITMFLMTAETYLWLVLCLIIFNYKKRRNDYGLG